MKTRPTVATVLPTGTFLVRPGFAAIRDAFRCHGIDDSVRKELRSIVLVEIEVHDASGPLDLGEWHQEGLQHVPYDEAYFSLDRRMVLGGSFHVPNVCTYALAFYLHFFDPCLPLVTPHGTFPLPLPVSERPAHLIPLRYSYGD